MGMISPDSVSVLFCFELLLNEQSPDTVSKAGICSHDWQEPRKRIGFNAALRSHILGNRIKSETGSVSSCVWQGLSANHHLF